MYRVRDSAITVAGALRLGPVACCVRRDDCAAQPLFCQRRIAGYCVPCSLVAPHHPTPPLRVPPRLVDDVPDDGLDVPLRLEKMANEVTYQRLRAALTVRPGCPQEFWWPGLLACGRFLLLR